MKHWLWYGLFVAIIVFYRVTWRLFLPFLLALAIALALKSLVNWLEARINMNRTLATILVFLLTALIGTGLIVLATAALVQGVALFIDRLPEYRHTFAQQADNLVLWAGRLFVHIPPDVLQVARGTIDQIIQTVNNMLAQLGQIVLAGLAALPGLATLLLIAALAAFFLTKDWNWFVSGFLSLLPADWRRTVERTGSKVGSALGRYVLAQLILISISTGLSIVGLAVIGADRWLAAGLIGGALDLLPVLGPGLMYLPWVVYSFIVGRPFFGISLLVIYGIVSGVRQLCEAKVVGQSLGIHPLIMIAGLYWGVLLLGAKGLLLAPLVLIIGKAYMDVRNDHRY